MPRYMKTSLRVHIPRHFYAECIFLIDLFRLYFYHNNMKTYFVYILTNFSNTTLYVGVTNDLARRIFEHKTKVVKGFTEKYNIDKLVYFEQYNDIDFALNREKSLKKLSRKNKEKLINKSNKEWNDLSYNL